MEVMCSELLHKGNRKERYLVETQSQSCLEMEPYRSEQQQAMSEMLCVASRPIMISIVFQLSNLNKP